MNLSDLTHVLRWRYDATVERVYVAYSCLALQVASRHELMEQLDEKDTEDGS